jgi:hypothetical protein
MHERHKLEHQAVKSLDVEIRCNRCIPDPLEFDATSDSGTPTQMIGQPQVFEFLERAEEDLLAFVAIPIASWDRT